jgi:ketosteroid isomerase-like protein
MNAQTVEQEIQSLEDRRYRAMVESDAKTLAELLADELVYTHSTGAVDTKASYIESIRTRSPYRKVDRLQEAIQLYGDTAIITGHAHLHVETGGAQRILDLRHLNVWVKRPAGWQMVAWEATPIQG